MKKIVIVKPGCRELGNELLNHMSIYAYALETGAHLINHSGFGHTGLRRVLHALYARIIKRMHRTATLEAWRAPVYLPPTKALSRKLPGSSLYLYGWLFRNPEGITKYREELLQEFGPSPAVQKKIQNILLPQQNKTLIGVHLRLTKFTGFPEGDFLVSATRVERIVDEYLQENNLDIKNIALIIISDSKLPEDTFGSYLTHMSLNASQTNLFLLSKCSVVIGTNTAFANLAAWFGNVPHVVTTNNPLDWVYYKNRVQYFTNKYATFAFGHDK